MAILVTFFSGFYMALMAYLYSSQKINKYFFYILVGLFSGVFSTYFSHDARAYQQLFLYYSKSALSNTLNDIMSHEIFFVLSVKFLSFLPVLVFFCLYAMASFAIKFALMERVSRNPLLSLLCFFAFFFLYLDGTVVRVSLGIAVAYWGIYLLSRDRLLSFSFVILGCSLLFHYSLLVLMVMPLFRTRLSIKVIWALTAVFFTLYFLGFGLLDCFSWLVTFLDTSYPGVNKLMGYLHNSTIGYPYSPVLSILFFLCFITYFFYKNELNEFELIAFNMFFLSSLIVVIFYQSQIFQNRISEIFRYSIIFIAPFFYKMAVDVTKNSRWAMAIYISFLGGYFIYFYYLKETISEKNLIMLNALFFK